MVVFFDRQCEEFVKIYKVSTLSIGYEQPSVQPKMSFRSIGALLSRELTRRTGDRTTRYAVTRKGERVLRPYLDKHLNRLHTA